MILTNKYITWKSRSHTIQVPVATVDHVLELSKGGNNHNNLVASCTFCNNSRSSQPKQPRETCKKCGSPNSKGKKCCILCEAKSTSEKLGEDWEFWLDGEEGLWQYSETKMFYTTKEAFRFKRIGYARNVRSK